MGLRKLVNDFWIAILKFVAFAGHSIIESWWKRWWWWGILLIVASKVKVIIVHLVFRNIVRSEDVTNVERKLHYCGSRLVLHLVFSNELEDHSSHNTPHQSEDHGDQHGRKLEPSLVVTGPGQNFRAVQEKLSVVIVFMAGIRQREDLVKTLLYTMVELIVFSRGG